MVYRKRVTRQRTDVGADVSLTAIEPDGATIGSDRVVRGESSEQTVSMAKLISMNDGGPIHARRNRRGASVHLSSIVILFLMNACTYGPPRLVIQITNHTMSPTAPVTAFAVHATWLRDPTGLSAFPDGGSPRVLTEAAALYTCDTLARTVQRVWRGDRPPEIRSGFTPWLGPWSTEGLYFSLSGYSTSTTVTSAFRRWSFRISPEGRLETGVQPPAPGFATSEPAACAAAVLAAARADPPARLSR